MKRLTALIILDGFGYSDAVDGNAVRADGIPAVRALKARWPHTLVAASGEAVGLPAGQMGNSEVGHLNIGAGRVVYQELSRISNAINDGSFYSNPAFCGAVDACLKTGGALHLMGLCSDGGVHSHLEHMYALVRLAKERGLDRVFIHCFMDGRDVAPHSGIDFIRQVEDRLAGIGCGRIATVAGRYYAMDRDNRYDRVERAYRALTAGEGREYDTAEKAMADSYAAGVTDEFIEPTVIVSGGKPVATVNGGDSVIFFNFRPDRARELTRAFIFPDFDGFVRPNGYFPLTYVAMTQYDVKFSGRLAVAFAPETPENTLGEYVSGLGKTQLRIAETEKYAHVTFFFNGGVEAPYPGEDRALIPSPGVATYDLQPEMSAYQVTDEAVKRIESGKYDLMVLNFANADMVGHTGVMEAAVEAVHTVDECCARVVNAVLKAGGRVIVTADHGNSEHMKTGDGSPFTAHTTNPVPLILAGEGMENVRLAEDGRLCDVAPTLLWLMGLEKPAEMTGKNLAI